MRITILSFLFVGIFGQTARAQDSQPSQFLSAPLAYNPGMTGLMTDDMRVAVNYEKQHDYAHNNAHTTHLSYDMPVMRGVLPKGNAVGFGIMYHNETYNNKTYIGSPTWKADNNAAGLSFAYHIGLGKKSLHHISLGAQSIFTNYSYFYSHIYDSTYEQGDGYRTNYNWGITYSGILSAKTALYSGFARYASSMPFSSDRYTLFAGITRNLGKNTTLYANAAHNFKSAYRSQASAYVRFLLNPGRKDTTKTTIAAYAGTVLLLDEAAMLYIGFEAANTRLGFSIDPRPLTSKSYPAASFQVSLTYTGKLRVKQSPTWHCPSMY